MFPGKLSRSVFKGALVVLLAASFHGRGADLFDWRGGENKVTAEIEHSELVPLLEQIAAATGWQIYIEPGTRRIVSTKFRDRTVGQALQLLLGELSYFRVPPETNAPARLYVFRTTREEATQLIKPVFRSKDPTARPIPNELVIKVKCGTNIDELAKRFGAKVLARADNACTYRLGFESAEAAEAARQQLENLPEVEGIDSNYWMRGPEQADGLNLAANQNLNIKPRAPGECSNPIIGLIDTAVQPTGTAVDALFLPSIAVAGEYTPPSGQPTHATPMAYAAAQALAQKGNTTGTRFLSVDVYGPNASTTTFDVANGIVQAINKGANIINLSLGSAGDSEFLRGVVRQGVNQGVLFLAAAGNEPGTAPTYPAAYPEVVAVTARGRDGSIASYANRGDFVDLSAPGSVMFPFQGQSWMVMGTSAATAYASGVAAGLWDCNKTTAGQVAASLRELMPVKQTP